MSRLIDADRFEAFCTGIPKEVDADSFMRGIDEVIYEIDNAPTVDAVEVVRCRDCKYCRTSGKGQPVAGSDERYYTCRPSRYQRKWVPLDGFCYKGERRGGDR